MDDTSAGGPVPVQVPTSSNTIGEPDRVTPGGSKKNTRINSEQLRSILKQVAGPGTSSESNKQPIEFSSFLNKTKVGDIIEKYADRLIPHLPKEEPVTADEAELKLTVTTPQFRQAANSFGHALQTGQIGPVLKMFDVDEATAEAASTGDVLSFAKKLTSAERGEKQGE